MSGLATLLWVVGFCPGAVELYAACVLLYLFFCNVVPASFNYLGELTERFISGLTDDEED